jgi:hypothetical protein
MVGLTSIPWWQWLPWPYWRIVAEVEAADEVPVRLPRKGVVLVRQWRTAKWLAFDCPCRGGHRVLLNLESSRWPHWRLLDNRSLTLSPSIDERTAMGRCHYFIVRGRVVWV